jgi:hypothetical protein
LRLHAVYARRRGLHVGAELYMAALDEWADKPSAKPVITGASGAKSTLVANWLAASAPARHRSTLSRRLTGSADPVLLMRRLWNI